MQLRKAVTIVAAAAFSVIAVSAQSVKWIARYDGPTHGYDGANAIAVDSTGNVYIAGYAGSEFGQDICTIKYDANGNQLWVQRFNGPGQNYNWATAIAVDENGNVYVAGATGWNDGSGEVITNVDYCTIKYDANGNELWVRGYDGPGHDDDIVHAMALDECGSVYITGVSYGGSETGSDACTIKYNMDGNQVWIQRYDGPAHEDDEARAIALDARGNVYVTGYSTGLDTGPDYCTIKYDANGNQLWVQSYDGPGHAYDQPSAIALDGAANVYVTGYSEGGSETAADSCTIKYDTNGNQLWVQRYDGPAHGNDDMAAIAVDASGNVCVTGSSYGGSKTGYDYCTIRYDTNGNQVWVQRYDGLAHGDDHATAIALDVSGNIYVTGSSAGFETYSDLSTIEYDSNGNQMWVERYDGPAHNYDYATAVAVDRSGNVCVTGWSFNESGNTDIVTIMYARPHATVSGVVALDLYSGGAGIVGTLEYRLPGTTQPIWSSQIALDANGGYQDATAPVGTFDIVCKFPNWLRQVLPDVTISVSGATADFSLANGDADGNNHVGVGDLSLILGNFGTSGTPPIDGDLTWDGKVNLPDLSAVLANFGTYGAP